MKGKISFVIGVLGIIGSIFLHDKDLKSTVIKIALGFIIGAVVEFLVFIVENRKHWILFKTKIFNRRKPIRATLAYLFRIEVNGKYVLIKRHKKDLIGYQPVGGAFKYFKEENRELFNKLGIEPCNLVPRDVDTKDDLRIRINKRKHLIQFLKWFESRKNREIDPWREFYEELVEPGLLPIELFKHVKYVYIGNHKELVPPSPGFPIDQFRYAEIYELRPDSDEQKEAIENLIYENEITFATPDEIRSGSNSDGLTILPHTFKILPR
jgi:hypothetical protein